MVLNIRSDGTGPTALEQLVAQHRSGFCANFDLQAGADFADTLPPVQAAHASSEFLADDPPAPPVRRQSRRPLGAVCVVAFLALCCAGAPLLAHVYASRQQSNQAPAPRTAPAVWA